MIWTSQFETQFIPAKKRSWRDDPKLMIVLHGRGDSLQPFRSLPEELELPEMNYLLLNAPRRYDGGFSWYGLEPHHERGILQSRAKLHEMMREIEAQGWSSRDIFLFGLSQGCLMSCDLSMTYAKPFAGLLGISGYVWLYKGWRQNISRGALKTPWIMTHGFDDQDIPIEETRKQVRLLLDAGLTVEWMEMAKGHEVEATFEAPMLGRWIRRRVAQRAPRLLSVGS